LTLFWSDVLDVRSLVTLSAFSVVDDGDTLVSLSTVASAETGMRVETLGLSVGFFFEFKCLSLRFNGLLGESPILGVNIAIRWVIIKKYRFYEKCSYYLMITRDYSECIRELKIRESDTIRLTCCSVEGTHVTDSKYYYHIITKIVT